MPRALRDRFFNDGRIATEGNDVIVNVAGRAAIGTIDFTRYHGLPRPPVVPRMASTHALAIGFNVRCRCSAARRRSSPHCASIAPASCTTARRLPSYPTRYIGSTLLPAASWPDASG
ncbi:hypothetical protein WK36_34140 [Burkholderia cepacia]|nr:hypothetical protein WK36_34140 [Burkholderia cepacia]